MSKLLSTMMVLLALGGLVGCGDSAASDDSGGGANCGNGTIDTDEQCDPGPPLNLGGETCMSATVNLMPSGPLGCNQDCSFNTSMCTAGGAGGTSGAGGTGGGGAGGTGGQGGVGGSSGVGGVGGS